jgi:antitoxin (DNA-binding transcriptional repressor) of toxin-antitoxin stability system
MQVPINEAKTQLSKLIEAAIAGEDVIIARGQKPIVRLVAMQNSFTFGVLGDVMGNAPDFNEEMSLQELNDWSAV